MAKPKALSSATKLILGLAASWLSAGRALAHAGEATPHSHQDWRPLVVAVAGLLTLFGVLGVWRYRRWLQQRREPEAFVPPPIGLPVSDDDDRS